jgi:energy-converting hydrogenase Eha subunit A
MLTSTQQSLITGVSDAFEVMAVVLLTAAVAVVLTKPARTHEKPVSYSSSKAAIA